ncbi:ABC-type amino acid transport substrate-binding protein [Paraburkholderia sp. Clong3]
MHPDQKPVCESRRASRGGTTAEGVIELHRGVKTVKKLLAALTVALLATVSIGAHAKDWSTIRFGVDASYPPFESKGADGKLVGFDIDLGNEICKRVGAKCVWVENDFDGMIPALKAKKFDGGAVVDVDDAATRRTDRFLVEAVQHADAPRREAGLGHPADR